MKTKEEKIKNIRRLINRKESIRVKHLLAAKKHLDAAKACKEYINNYKKQLEEC